MKKLLEKPWAKALAFLLTLLPGTAAVYGGVELVYICVYNMHTDRRLDMLWAVTAVCAVVAAASLVFSLSAAGHWPGHEGIHLTWVEKIPVDLFVLGLTCVWYIYLDAVYYPSATLGLAVFVALAYLFVLAFTARCKAGMVLADLVVVWGCMVSLTRKGGSGKTGGWFRERGESIAPHPLLPFPTHRCGI